MSVRRRSNRLRGCVWKSKIDDTELREENLLDTLEVFSMPSTLSTRSKISLAALITATCYLLLKKPKKPTAGHTFTMSKLPSLGGIYLRAVASFIKSSTLPKGQTTIPSITLNVSSLGQFDTKHITSFKSQVNISKVLEDHLPSTYLQCVTMSMPMEILSRTDFNILGSLHERYEEARIRSPCLKRGANEITTTLRLDVSSLCERRNEERTKATTTLRHGRYVAVARHYETESAHFQLTSQTGDRRSTTPEHVIQRPILTRWRSLLSCKIKSFRPVSTSESLSASATLIPEVELSDKNDVLLRIALTINDSNNEPVQTIENKYRILNPKRHLIKSERVKTEPPNYAEWERFEFSYPVTAGRTYAGLNGDINPIHVSPLAAKLFGYKSCIAHGMFSVCNMFSLDDDTGKNEVLGEFIRPVILPEKVVGLRNGEEYVVGFYKGEEFKVCVRGVIKHD